MKASTVRRKLETFTRNPSKVIRKYARLLVWNAPAIICSVTTEDYDQNWRHTSFRGKVILDLGADWSSTAYYFLRNGAKKVIAVEGDEKTALQLHKNYGKTARVVCIHKRLSCAKHFETLIQQFKLDIVKVDVEGSEIHLLDASKNVISYVDEWLIEAHSKNLFNKFCSLYSSLGYKIQISLMMHPEIGQAIIYARKNSKTLSASP